DNLLNVQFASETSEAGVFEVYDEIGRMVKNIEFEPENNQNQIQINDLQPGRYFIRIKNGNNIATHSFIKI
ncbi:MAG TPA: T9SS type A sorting domain-containing protein, partial [Bacteroidetes bacterium]|nr:T9SS type A sorting domain-containing protein [Bacteroidota bacterium]